MHIPRRGFITAALSGLALTTLAPVIASQDASNSKKQLRILLLNPNSSEDFTNLIHTIAKQYASKDVVFVPITAPFGPAYVGSEAAISIAGHALVESLAYALTEYKEPFDAAIIAGFGAGSLSALQEMAPFPILSLFESSISVALLYGQKFSILTGGDRWVPILTKQVEDLGLSSRLASVKAVPLTGAEIAADQQKAIKIISELSEQCIQDGASCVIHGGAGLAGLAQLMNDKVSIPIIDNVAVTVSLAEMLARTVPRVVNPLDKNIPPIGSKGLSEPMTKFLNQS